MPSRPVASSITGQQTHHLLNVCNALGLTSVAVAAGRNTRTSSHRILSASNGRVRRTSTATRTSGLIRRTLSRKAHRASAGIRAKGKYIFRAIDQASRRATSRSIQLGRGIKIQLRQRSRAAVLRLDQLDRRYRLAESVVGGTCSSTVSNFLSGSMLLCAVSVVAAAVSVAVAGRCQERRGVSSHQRQRFRRSYLGSSGRSFLPHDFRTSM